MWSVSPRIARIVPCLLVAGLLSSLAALAAGEPRRIAAGFDPWQTLGSGATRYDFAAQPIPAGFFCAGSEPFRGAVDFEGVPLRTEPAGLLGTTDTVVERLDAAVFDERGVATTRLRARALHLLGTKLVENRCGAWKVTASLAGTQPVTRLTFYREDAYGGRFSADLKLRVQVTFTEVRTGEARTLVRRIDMPTVDRAPFAFKESPVAPCLAASAVTGPGPLVEDVVLLDGHVDDRSAPGVPTKLTPRREVLSFKSNDGGSHTGTPPPAPEWVATGCRCNSAGQCRTTYTWHQPDCINGGYNCELHFTLPPCQVYNFSICGGPVNPADVDQLRVLHDLGLLREDPAAVARKQARSADQIRADQARRLAAQVRAVEKN
jgi:hypothetical protein